MHLSQERPCPQCERNLPEIVVEGNTCECPYCGTRLRFSDRNTWISLLLSFASSLTVAQKLDLQAWAGIIWVPVFLFHLFVAAVLLSFLKAPLLIDEDNSGRRFHPLRTLSFFIRAWIALTLFMAVYGYFLGWAGVFMGASKEEILEGLDLWSVPLRIVNPAFIVSPDKAFVTDMGIIAANSYFFALGLTAVFKIVHMFIQRSRVIQLSISGVEIGDDDDDL